MEVENLLEYVNSELRKGSNLTQIAKRLGKNESTIRKRLNKLGYRRVGNEFVLKPNNTCSTTNSKEEKIGSISRNTTCSNTTQITKVESDVDMEKLKLLLDNVDRLLRLIPNTTCSTTRVSINKERTKVTSLRINEEIYRLVRERSIRDNINIADIVNRALEDYLNNYL